ncbi:MAG: hypothetical protein EHM25_00315 [Nitrosopumilales archaeon]|nr:MAG: hypothetical protein EHM25_00315 [Nitrosopumilales archaeon]
MSKLKQPYWSNVIIESAVTPYESRVGVLGGQYLKSEHFTKEDMRRTLRATFGIMLDKFL